MNMCTVYPVGSEVDVHHCTSAFRWTSNPLEDFSLFVVLDLAQWPVSNEARAKAGAVDVVKPIMSEGDLQGLKATMACAFLDAEWSSFPDGRYPASKAVSELMANTVEKKGEGGQYGAYGVFKLYTASKVYRDLAKAASKADQGSGKCTSKVLAIPSSVSLNLQIISDLVLSAMDDAEGGPKHVPDAMSAEYFVGSSTPCYLLFSREDNLLASPFNPSGRVVRYNGGSVSLIPLHLMILIKTLWIPSGFSPWKN